jgi:MraZ protein
MLIGEYLHRLDPKRRVSIPAKMRKVFGDKVIVTRGLDKCLFLYTEPQWQVIASKLSELSMGQTKTRQFVRMMLAGAEEVELDTLGRVLIPEHLASYAGLKGEVVVTGVYTRAEIWAKDTWHSYRSLVTERADELAEELGNQGVY